VDTSLADTLVGRVLDGRYRIQERIARGGMATVYRALDTRLDRLVAVKVMHSTLAEDPEFVSKFTREAKSAARLSHPNVVAVFDQGSDGGVVFLVMEYVDGATLRDLIRERGRLSPRQSLDVIAPVLSALDAAHRAGIVHRDIKPENVLISSEGRVKVADFGLARAIAASHLTATTGLLIGTAAYLAPEQIEHGVADARTDLYAAGIVLYELLTGTPPYVGATPMAVIFKHVHETVPAPSLVRPEVSKPLDALVLDATRRDPEERPPSADALLEQLEAVSRTLPPEPLDLTQQTQVINQHLTTILRSDPPAGGPAKTLVAPPAWPPAPVPKKAPPGRPRKQVSWWRGWRLAVLLLVIATLAAGAIGAYLGLSERNGHSPGASSATTSAAGAPTTAAAPAQVALPNLVGKTQDEATQLAQGLNVVIDPSPVFDDKVPANSVVSQVPAFTDGAMVDPGATVTLTLSKGPQTYPIPAAALVGQTPDQAAATLVAAHLTLGKQSTDYDPTVPAGHVIKATTDAGTPLPAGSPVDVDVSKGPAPVAVPDETGKTRTAALADLKAAQFTSVAVTFAFNDTVASGHVVSQTPKGKEMAQTTADVSLVVSKGPELFAVPNLKGLSAETAKAKLVAMGFKYHTQQLPNGPGNVLTTIPGPGAMRARGTVITLEIF
jgi:serine/threonine protein kinase/beta-lactam-binding protein with PASTA domain